MKKLTSLLMMLLLVAVTGWAAETTVSKTMTEIVEENSYTVSAGSSVTCYTSFSLDENITISTSGDPNCGSFWSNGSEWRLYQNKSGDITVTAADGCELVSVKITYNSNNGGVLKSGSTTITSGTAYEVSGSSVTYTVGNSGNATNGQARITAIEVTYETGGSDDPTAVGPAVVTLTQNAQDNTKLDVVITAENAAGYYYTVDGSDPIESSTAIDYAEGAQIDLTQVASPVTVKAVGYDSELEFGPIGKATFTLDPITITFDPASCNFTESQDVTVTVAGTIGDAEVVYKVNGTEVNNATGEFTFTETSILEVEVLDVRKGADVVSASATYTKVEPSTGGEGTITFGSASGSTNINGASVTGDDDLGNTWTITTEGTTSFTPNSGYAQVGSGNKPASSITFTTTLPEGATVTAFSAKFGGFNGTAGDIALTVGGTTVGSGSLNASNDVTVEADEVPAEGNVLTVTVTGIAKGVKVYNISYAYETGSVDPTAVGPAVVKLTQNTQDNTKLDVVITAKNAVGYSYTVDGSDPTESSTAIGYAEGAQIDLTQVASPVTVKAVGYDDEMNFGEIGEATFTLDPITITFDPASRNFTESQDVTVTVAGTIGNAEVVYKVNGTEVNNATGEFTFTETSTLEVEVLDERAGADIVTASATYTKIDPSQYGKIVFDDNGSDESSAYNFDPEYVVIGSDLISTMSGTKVYKGKTGIKLSSGSVNGKLQITLAAPVNVTKVSVWAAQWLGSSGNADSNAAVSVNDETSQALESSTLTKYDFDITGEVTEIEIAATGRIYVKGIDWEVAAPAIVTLEEALSGEAGNVTLSEPVKVVSVANGVAYASNGTDWVALKGDFAEGSTYKNISGVIGDLATLPVIESATGELDEETQITAEVKSYDLASPSAGEYAKPKAAQVVKFRGFVFDGFLRGYSNNTGESLKLIGADALEQGTSLLLTTAIQYDEAAAPVARRAQSSETFAGISAVVLGSETPTAVDGIVADKAVESVRYYNVAGQVSSKPFDGMNIVVTRMVDGTVKTAKVVK